MGQNAIDAIAAGDYSLGRPGDDAREGFVHPGIAGHGLDGRHWAARRGQPSASVSQLLTDRFGLAVEQRLGEIAGRVEQQPLDEIGGQRSPAGLGQPVAEPGDFVLKGSREWAVGPLGRRADQSDQSPLEVGHAASLVRLDQDDRHAQLLPQPSEVDFESAMLGHVDHVQHDDGRQAQLQHLADQVEIALQVAGVDDRHHQIDRPHVLAAGQQHVDGDHLVGRARRQAVGAGQIDNVETVAGMFQMADFFLDRHARIVAGALADAGQGIEESRLARVRVADQGHGVLAGLELCHGRSKKALRARTRGEAFSVCAAGGGSAAHRSRLRQARYKGEIATRAASLRRRLR